MSRDPRSGAQPTGGDFDDDDVLETPERAGRDRVRLNWARTPRWLRASAVIACAGATVVIAATVTLQELTHQAMDRRLNDTVGIGAALDVSSNSMAPLGGRVDYSVTIYNKGPRRVRVMGVSIDQGGLRIADRGLGSDAFVGAGAAASVRLSVRLDCDTKRPGDDVDGLRGVVNISPLSGSLHRVSLTFARAGPLIDVAQTLCNIDPHKFGELSGPILKANTG